MIRMVEIIVFVISTQCRAFPTVLFDLSARITDLFDAMGLIGGFTICGKKREYTYNS